MIRILRPAGQYCDVLPYSGGVFGFVWSGSHLVVAEIEGHEVWRTPIPETAALFLRAASSPAGWMAAVGQGLERGACLFVDAGGWIELGPTHGQDVAVIRWREDMRAFEVWFVEDLQSYTRVVVSEVGRQILSVHRFPLADVHRAGTSQGIRDVFDDGSLLWGDSQRPVIASERLLSRWHQRGFVIAGEKNEGDPGASVAWTTDVRYVTVFGPGAQPPNLAVDGARVAVCAWTRQGACAVLLDPPYPPHEPIVTPEPVEDDMQAPRVNVVSFSPSIKKGEPWGAVVEDPENKALVTLEFVPQSDGSFSFHSQISNEKGSDRSGAVRRVEVVCPESPPPPPPPPQTPEQACRAIWQEELERPIDDEGLTDCVFQLTHGRTADEQRAIVRASEEYAELQRRKAERVVLPRLVRDGTFFRLETGDPFTIVEASDFSLYKRFEGEDLTPVLEQRRTVGYNMVRVWLLNTSVVEGGILPNQYPDFYARLPEFCDLCARHGLYVEFTVFTQTPSLMPDADGQQRHLAETAAALRETTNALLELVNEADHRDADGRYDNMPRLDVLTKPDGVTCSHGSNNADHEPPRPTWDYELYHSNGLSEWWRKTGHNAMELADESGVPAWANENTRFPDDDDNPAHAYDAARAAALLCAGSCFHSVNGKSSRLWEGRELECATAWAEGARSVPLEFRTGRYLHRTDLEGADCLRAYERRLADGRVYIVRIRP